MPGLETAWVGMNVPDIETGGRPWVWEVVTPDAYDASPRLREDPLVLSVHQDIVIAEIHHLDHGQPFMKMQIPVTEAPDTVLMAGSLHPDSPWSLRLEVGWTIQALGAAAQCWIDKEAPGTAFLDTPKPLIPKDQNYKLHPDIDIESAAFDRLLTLEHHDAAVVTSLLARIHEALLPHR